MIAAGYLIGEAACAVYYDAIQRPVR